MTSLGRAPLSEKLAEQLAGEKIDSREDIAAALAKRADADPSVKGEADAVVAELAKREGR